MDEDSSIVGPPSISSAGTVLCGFTVLRNSSRSGAGGWGSHGHVLVLYLVIQSQLWTDIVIIIFIIIVSEYHLKIVSSDR